MPASDPPSDDYFQYYSDDPALLQAAEALDPPPVAARRTPSPAYVLSNVHDRATPAPGDAAPLPSDPPDVDTSLVVKWQEHDTASPLQGDFHSSGTSLDTYQAFAELLGGSAIVPSQKAHDVVNSTSMNGDTAAHGKTQTPTDWDSSPFAMTPGVSRDIMVSNLRPLSLESVCRAQIAGEYDGAPIWWLDGCKIDQFVCVARITEWTYRDGSIHAVIVDDTRTFRALWGEDVPLPSFTAPQPSYGDLVLFTARIEYSPEGFNYEPADDGAREWLHLVILDFKILQRKSSRPQIEADLQAYSDLLAHYDSWSSLDVDHQRLVAIQGFVPGPLHPISEFTWSLDRDIKWAIAGLLVDDASLVAIKISMVYRLTRRCQAFVRLLDILRDVWCALAHVDMYSPTSVNNAFALLLNRRLVSLEPSPSPWSLAMAGHFPGPLSELHTDVTAGLDRRASSSRVFLSKHDSSVELDPIRLALFDVSNLVLYLESFEPPAASRCAHCPVSGHVDSVPRIRAAFRPSTNPVVERVRSPSIRVNFPFRTPLPLHAFAVNRPPPNTQHASTGSICLAHPRSDAIPSSASGATASVHARAASRSVRFAPPPSDALFPKYSLQHLRDAHHVFVNHETAVRWSYYGREVTDFVVVARVLFWDLDSDGLLADVEDLSNNTIQLLNVDPNLPDDMYPRVRPGDIVSINGSLKISWDQKTHIRPFTVVVLTPVTAPLARHLTTLQDHLREADKQRSASRLATLKRRSPRAGFAKIRSDLIFNWLIRSANQCYNQQGLFDRVRVTYFQQHPPVEACARLIQSWYSCNTRARRAIPMERVLRDLAVPLLDTKLPNLVDSLKYAFALQYNHRTNGVFSDAFDTLVGRGDIREIIVGREFAFYF
ncbi:uncharacterized protein B0H18DRAFT_956899 [Fomitopsis serialis]|uniref:uncharacterized protein n=1 Tax=Fomitopsis serialis TaxID=139415 RepID=UPI002008432A|nr:uncharacterized protein B0H18DRAFT_956899 [Neoantrodia serialis]KAH9920763.1 hypothetical protein B0H18DRAFT_956899 [Neoantrodia serialis]